MGEYADRERHEWQCGCVALFIGQVDEALLTVTKVVVESDLGIKTCHQLLEYRWHLGRGCGHEEIWPNNHLANKDIRIATLLDRLP